MTIRKGDDMSYVSRTRCIVGVVVALGVFAAAVPAQAVQTGVQKGDWLIRGGLGHVAPTGKSETVPGVGGKVEAGSSTNLAVNFTYMLTDHVGVELLGALPFKHNIKHNDLGKVGETNSLPPTVILLYNFAPGASVRPYAGIGLNYTWFFNEKTTGALDGTKLRLSNSTGLAAEVGVDVDINRTWFVNASVWHIDIDTRAESSAVGKFDVDIDPWVYFVGIGRRF